jgi:hypothetical protein
MVFPYYTVSLVFYRVTLSKGVKIEVFLST